MSGIIHISSPPLHPIIRDFLDAARVPASVPDCDFGLWSIRRERCQTAMDRHIAGWPTITVLSEWTEATMHHARGYTVMEDGRTELLRHVPIWKAASGRVLVNGLGLGCVVRGLLTKPEVTHIDVVELSADIIRVVGPSLTHDRRVCIHQSNALDFPISSEGWDFAWHDISTPDDIGLQSLHAKLIVRFHGAARRQGAWAFPRQAKMLAARLPNVGGLIGGQTRRERRMSRLTKGATAPQK